MPSSALAWPLEPLPIATLPDEVTGISLVPRGDRTELVALSHTLGWLLDPASGEVRRLIGAGGVGAVAGDLDDDGSNELIVCGSSGLAALRWEGDSWPLVPVQLTNEPCEAIEVVSQTEPFTIAIATPSGLQVMAANNGALLPLETVPLPEGGAPLLATRGPLVAATRAGARELLEWSPSGVSTIATGGSVAGLTYGPHGWTWTLPERSAIADVTHRLVAIGPDGGSLQSAHLDDDGVLDLIVSHNETIAVVPSAVESEITHGPLGSTDLLISGDADGDGCGDLVRSSRSPAEVQVFRSTACIGVSPHTAVESSRSASLIPVRPGSTDTIRYTPAPDPLEGISVGPGGTPVQRTTPSGTREPVPTVPHAMGMDLPPLLGSGPLTVEERLSKQRYVLLGTGWVVGGSLDRTLLRIPVFPALSVELEGGGPRARWFIGGDSAGLFFWLIDRGTEEEPDTRGGIHLANFSAGATFGSPRLRAGPFVTAGIWNAGAGVRAVATPWKESRYEQRGVEVRLTYFAPSVGEVMFMYVWSEPTRKPSALPADHEFQKIPDYYAGRELPSGVAVCHRINVGLGAVVGGSSTRHSWQYVGRDVAVEVRASPALAVSCDTGEKGTGMLLSMETAPLFSYLTTGDNRRYHLGSATAGWMVGGRSWRVGPIATAGVWALGGGVRGAADLFTDKQGLHHRLEVRAQALMLASPAAEGWVMYGVSFDPRR